MQSFDYNNWYYSCFSELYGGCFYKHEHPSIAAYCDIHPIKSCIFAIHKNQDIITTMWVFHDAPNFPGILMAPDERKLNKIELEYISSLKEIS